MSGYFPNFGTLKVGDRVRHVGRNEDGTVVNTIGYIKVDFDKLSPRGHRSVGQYDEKWFAMYPRLLQIIQRQTEPK